MSHLRRQHFTHALVALCFGAIAAVSSLTSANETTADTHYDLAIIGGRVIDPETGLDAIRNIGIRDDKIAVITEDALAAKRVIDAIGLVVSPGFIDMHAHGQSILSGRVQAFDGVTTALELESGTYPVADFYAARAAEGRPINYGASVNWLGTRLAAVLDMDPKGNADWFDEAMNQQGWQNSIATPEQLAEIEARVTEGLNEGGLGVGFLTGYAPGSGYKEYYAVSKLAAARNAPTFTHARYLSMAEPESSFEAMQEIVGIAASTGVQAHIVHMNSISLKDIRLIGEMVRGAQERGAKISTEAYPYGAGATSIGAAMFRGEGWRDRIGGITAESFVVDGQRLDEDTFTRLQNEAPSTGIIIHFLDADKPADQTLLDHSMLFPDGVIASDGGDWTIAGKPIADDVWPLPSEAWSHPRSAGTYMRFISQYARDRDLISLPEAIRRVSYGPASILEAYVPQMRHKGRLQEGADADIVIFDFDAIRDAATFEQPAQLSQGVKYLLVNGQLLIQNGELDTKAMPGQPVRNNPITATSY